jgi:hypothetical protein
LIARVLQAQAQAQTASVETAGEARVEVESKGADE